MAIKMCIPPGGKLATSCVFCFFFCLSHTMDCVVHGERGLVEACYSILFLLSTMQWSVGDRVQARNYTIEAEEVTTSSKYFAKKNFCVVGGAVSYSWCMSSL